MNGVYMPSPIDIDSVMNSVHSTFTIAPVEASIVCHILTTFGAFGLDREDYLPIERNPLLAFQSFVT